MATPMAGGNIFELYRRLATGVPFTAAPLALPVPISVPGDDEVPPGPDVDELNRQFAETVVAAGQLRPTAQQQAEHEAKLREIIRQRGNKGNALLRREALQSRATPSHPDSQGGAIEYLNGPYARRNPQPGSLEYQQQTEGK